MAITVYSQNGCKNCTLVKMFITANGGTVNERNIDLDEKAFNELTDLGVMGLPVTVVNGKNYVGFTEDVKEALVHALGIDG